MKRKAILFFIIFVTLKTFAQADSINQRIFLIGDAGEMTGPTHPVIAWLKKNIDLNDEKITVLFLGDNIYPLGMPMEGEASYPEAKRILDDQISLVKGKKARAIFIPGNHDWKDGKLGGWQQVMNQVDYINTLDQKNIQAWPINGCPGPIQVELSDKVVVAIIDSQWFLFIHDKPGASSSCNAKTVDEFETELREIANSHPNQLLIVAMHHPVYSYGIHGGDYTLKEHIFPFTALNPHLYIPLPVLGSIYPLARGVFGSLQDVQHPLYKTFANTVEGVVKKHPDPVVVAGHDHGLQLIMKDSIPYIISGAGSVLSRIKPGKFSLYSDVEIGFSMIEVWKSGKVDVKFYNMNSSGLSNPSFVRQLKNIPPPPLAAVDTTHPILDSIAIVSANANLAGNGFKKFLVGKNYRKEWVQTVRVPVLDMGKEQGGLKPLKQGGGKQTKSLRVEDTSGKEWALRSVQKNPLSSIPADLRQTAVKDIVEDGISASYPYGSLSMAVLSHAAGVPYLRDRLVYLPDDPRLARFRSNFKNTLAFMEEREPPGIEKSENTDDVILKLAKNNKNRVDQSAVLKARLLDNFVMDFDRHEGQWNWVGVDSAKGKIYYPIPKDRDQVFFINQGLLPKLIKKPWLVPELQGFRAKASNIRTFNRAVRHFDRTFLTELNRDQWLSAIDSFLATMTDSVIELALHQQPTEIQGYRMQKIINTLKERRKFFKKEMMTYYSFISRTVTIVGSNEKDQFTITKNPNGTVHVVVHRIAKDSSIVNVMFDRLFDPKITKEIRLFGLNDDDRFIVEGGSSPIRIRIIGGSGNDEFINNGTGGKIWVYDVTFEKNQFSGNPGFHKIISNDPQVNRYDRLNFKYDFVNPSLAFAYNIDDGLFIGPKFEYLTQGFRKEPYGMRQFFMAERALKTASYHFAYDADFMQVIGHNDVVIRSDFRAPVNVTNFFGIGNETKIDETKPNFIQFYRARYNIINASVYLRRQLQSWMRVYLGPTFQYFKIDSVQNAGRFINILNNGLDHSILYNPRMYGGGETRLEINSKNNNIIPTRGFTLNAGIRTLFGMNNWSHNIMQMNIDMRVFMSLATEKRLVLASRFGWGKNIGKFEFEQAQYLSGTDNLRGYRKQRFAGRSMVYNNTELRIKIADFNTYLFPGSIGIQVFNDIGKVYNDNENSDQWHDGFGAGIWLAPIRRFVVTASLAHSVEEKALPRLTFGFEF